MKNILVAVFVVLVVLVWAGLHLGRTKAPEHPAASTSNGARAIRPESTPRTALDRRIHRIAGQIEADCGPSAVQQEKYEVLDIRSLGKGKGTEADISVMDGMPKAEVLALAQWWSCTNGGRSARSDVFIYAVGGDSRRLLASVRRNNSGVNDIKWLAREGQ